MHYNVLHSSVSWRPNIHHTASLDGALEVIKTPEEVAVRKVVMTVWAKL
jgi:hypothetical protein